MDRKEAIEVIKKNYPHVGISGSEFESALRELVPELKESEDERMRKMLIEIVNITPAALAIENRSELLAYLEKQKDKVVKFDHDREQKPVISDEAIRDGVAHFGITQYQIDYWLKKHINVVEQNPVKDTALQKAFINSKIDYTLEEKCYAFDYAEVILPTSVIYGENEEEHKLHKIIEAAFIAGQNKEQKPAEWSKEDESNLQSCIAKIEIDMQHWDKHGKTMVDGDIKLIDWLKSLCSKHHWKPSEEQISALEYFIRSWGESGTMSPQNPTLCAANSLLHDLKSL